MDKLQFFVLIIIIIAGYDIVNKIRLYLIMSALKPMLTNKVKTYTGPLQTKRSLLNEPDASI